MRQSASCQSLSLRALSTRHFNGRVSEYREERQVKVNTICIEEDPNIEPLHWLEVIQLKRTVYAKPFSLPPGVSTQSTVPQKATRETVTGTVLHYIQTLGRSFTLSELQRDEKLREACLDAVSKNCSHSEWSEVEVTRELTAVISTLPKEWHVVSTGLTTLAADIVYEVSHAAPSRAYCKARSQLSMWASYTILLPNSKCIVSKCIVSF